MSSKTWRRLRVVVEVPVRGNSFSEKDLRFAVQRAVDHSRPLLSSGDSVGRVEIKGYSSVMKAERRKSPHHESFSEARRLLTELNVRVSRLEDETNPHRQAGYD